MVLAHSQCVNVNPPRREPGGFFVVLVESEGGWVHGQTGGWRGRVRHPFKNTGFQFSKVR